MAIGAEDGHGDLDSLPLEASTYVPAEHEPPGGFEKVVPSTLDRVWQGEAALMDVKAVTVLIVS